MKAIKPANSQRYFSDCGGSYMFRLGNVAIIRLYTRP